MMMSNLKPLGDKIFGIMIDGFGEKTTAAGFIYNDSSTSGGAYGGAKPRWFLITHIGPDQKDFAVGEYALVEHTRWSRGLDLNGTNKEEDKFFLLDNNGTLGKSDIYPLT